MSSTTICFALKGKVWEIRHDKWQLTNDAYDEFMQLNLHESNTLAKAAVPKDDPKCAAIYKWHDLSAECHKNTNLQHNSIFCYLSAWVSNWLFYGVWVVHYHAQDTQGVVGRQKHNT